MGSNSVGASVSGAGTGNANNVTGSSENGGFVLKNAPWEVPNEPTTKRSSSFYHKQHKFGNNSGDGAGSGGSNSKVNNNNKSAANQSTVTAPDTESQKDFPCFAGSNAMAATNAANLKNVNVNSSTNVAVIGSGNATTAVTTPTIPSAWGPKN